MALRVLRLLTIASIFAVVLTVRTVAPIHASDDPADDATPALLDPSSTDLGEEPSIDPPPPPDPPTAPPPVEAEPPPADPVEPPPTDPPPGDTSGTVEPPIDPPVEEEPPPADTVVEPAPTDPPPADTVEVIEPPTEPPVEAEPPPADPVEPAPTDPPADTVEAVVPPPDPPVEIEPPGDTVEPAPTDPPVPDTITPPITDPFAVIGDSDVSDPSAGEPAPSVPSTHRSAVPVPPGADNPAQTATEPVVAIASSKTRRLESVEPDHAMALAPAIAAGAGLAAGLAITNNAPGSVAVAVEFGRAGSGWAGALVFNLWLRRQLRERRMSQRRLADLSGVDHSTISRLLRQDRRPSLTTATKLAGALKQLRGEQAEPEAADYFERIPEETVFPARRVELALRADEMLNDDQVRRLMNIYLEARRRNQASAPTGSARSRAAPARAAPDARG